MDPYQPPQQQYAQPPVYQPPQHVQHVVHHYYAPPKSSGVAALLELLPGLFFQTFGIGHMYAGNVGVGLLLMFGYWIVLFFNILLCFLLIGLITTPLCWMAMMVISTVTASNAANRANAARPVQARAY